MILRNHVRPLRGRVPWGILFSTNVRPLQGRQSGKILTAWASRLGVKLTSESFPVYKGKGARIQRGLIIKKQSYNSSHYSAHLPHGLTILNKIRSYNSPLCSDHLPRGLIIKNKTRSYISSHCSANLPGGLIIKNKTRSYNSSHYSAHQSLSVQPDVLCFP